MKTKKAEQIEVGDVIHLGAHQPELLVTRFKREGQRVEISTRRGENLTFEEHVLDRQDQLFVR